MSLTNCYLDEKVLLPSPKIISVCFLCIIASYCIVFLKLPRLDFALNYISVSTMCIYCDHCVYINSYLYIHWILDFK